MDRMLNKNQFKNLIWIIPAIIAFLMALIPTLKYQWPLSWDIIYHVQYAQIYAKYGLVLTDPLLNAPVGQKIGYPPLFHLLLAFLGVISKVDFFQIARSLQPFLAMFIVLSVTYVARKLYGTIAGISAGFLLLSSLLFSRIILPLPENLALIFLPLSVYFYYYSLKEKSLKYGIFAGLLFTIIIFTHEAATLSLFLIITAFSLVELIFYRDIHVFKDYGAFLLLPISLLIIGVVALLISSPNIVYGILNSGLTASTGFITSISNNQPLSIVTYFGYLGFLVLLFALVGAIVAFKKRNKHDILIFTWIIAMFFLSNAYWFGVIVITYRVLIYLLLPLSILGGFGLNQVYLKLKNYKNFSSKNFRISFLISVFALATFSGILTVENPKIAIFGAETQYGTIQIAPPSPSDIDLARWFNEYGDKNKSILTNNLFTGTFLVAETGMPLHYGFEDFNKNIPESAFKSGGIGYIVLDKRLTFNSTNGTLYIKQVNDDFYPLVYFSEDIPSHINEILPNFIKVVYQNNDYIVCQVQ